MNLSYLENLMVLSPHTDDETIGCGGLIHKLISMGGKVTIVQFAKYRSNHELRLEEFHNAMFQLGSNIDKIILNFAYDGCLDMVNKNNYVSKLDEMFQDIKPSAVLYPLPSHHQDHNLVYEVALAALRPMISTTFIKLKACYEYPPNFYYKSNFGNPNLFVELSKEDISAKEKALSEYKSQLCRDPRDLLDVSSVLELAGIRGKSICREYAEAFYTSQIIL